MKKILSLLTALLMLSVVSFSQAPGMFNYQGVARNSVGNVLQNQSISLRLTIHDGSAAGPVVYQESRGVVTNPFGLFNAQVGSAGASNVTGTIAGVNWGVGSKFIQVEIDPAGGTSFINIGTAQLASVPYSLFATLAGDLVLPFNKTQADAGTLFKITNSGTGAGSTSLEGLTNSTAGNVSAIIGTVTPTSPGGFSAGLRGVNNGTGGLGIGVYGSQAGSGWGVYGTTPSGIGVNGSSSSGFGVFGSSTSGTGVYGTHSAATGTTPGVNGESNSQDGNAPAVQGTITSGSPGGFSSAVRGTNNGTGGLGIGVTGTQAGSGWGVYGNTPSGIGVYGLSTSGFGVYGQSTTGISVYGVQGGAGTNSSGFFQNGNAANTAPTLAANTNGAGDAVQSIATGTGKAGLFNINNAANSNNAIDVTSNGTGRAGFFGTTNAASAANAVEVTTNGSGNAVVGSRTATTGTNAGVRGTSASQDGNAVGTLGIITSTTPGGFSAGVRGTNNGTGGLGIGVYGSQAGSGWGVYGTTPTGIGVHGNSSAGFGVYGLSTTGTGVYGTSSNGESGRFEITNIGNSSTALTVATSGTGHGGSFSTLNAAGTGDAVRASQSGLGRGVYSVINNTSNIVGAVRGETNGSGYGIFGLATGNGNAGFFQISNPASTASSMNVTTNGIGSGITIQLTNAGNGARGVDVLQTGVGPGVFATSAGGNAVWGITSSISAAGVIGDNIFGEAVVGRNRGGDGVGAVVGRNDSSGYGVRGFNTKDGIGVLGQSGISGGTGVAGRFSNHNAANTSTTVEVTTNGLGGGILVDMPAAFSGARGVDVNHQGVGTGVFSISQGGSGVWGITASISAAGVIGDNTFGEAVVGRNRGGNGVGAVVGRNDSSGYGVRGFNTKNGIGVLGQTGISGGTGRAGRFENVNAGNGTNVVEIAGNGTGTSLVVSNANAGATNLAIFSKGGVGNVVRIADNGEIFANGGFTVGGADVAEYFAAEGLRSSYEPGDVLVISQTSDRKVEKSSVPYSTLVSGVYATKPGMKLTEENAVDGDLSHLVPMGVIGVLPTKVCLEGGPIKRGDMLVTSSIPGVAMKADPDKVRVGQVLGKALQDFNANEIGKINVLVSVK